MLIDVIAVLDFELALAVMSDVDYALGGVRRWSSGLRGRTSRVDQASGVVGFPAADRCVGWRRLTGSARRGRPSACV
jgi:hypothetical protein